MCLSTEQVYHVTVPYQPSAVYCEAILKLSSPTHIQVLVPSNGSTIMEIPFKNIRRVGFTNYFGSNVIWFETCKKQIPDEFYFLSIPSGNHNAQVIVQEIKTATECCTGVLLIMEDNGGDKELSFISREHYGCQEFPVTARGRILQAGLRQLPLAWRSYMAAEIPHRMRRVSEPAIKAGEHSNGVSLEDFVTKGNRKVSTPTVVMPRRPTLIEFRQLSVNSNSSEEIVDSSDSGTASDVFDPPRSPSRRKLSQQSSFSSQDGSGASMPYSPTLPQEDIMEDPFEVFEDTSRSVVFSASTRNYSANNPRRPSAPNVPPRSVISLQQAHYVRRNMSTAH